MMIARKFTVIAWCTEPYKHLADGLRSDCKQYGYPFHLYELDKSFPNLAAAWCNHPRIIRQGVEDFGHVLFLDIECRIVKPIPAHWRAPLVSVREPAQHFWITYNTGTVMADRNCIPWLDIWVRLIEAWGMDHLPNNAFIYWPNDIGDELPFHAAVAALNVKLNMTRLAYTDRNSDAELARGLWKNQHTIIQHPTIHHWPNESDLLESKKLFVQNFSGDPAEAEAYFQTARSARNSLMMHDWMFDGEEMVYAPLAFWPDYRRQWIAQPVSLTSAQR